MDHHLRLSLGYVPSITGWFVTDATITEGPGDTQELRIEVGGTEFGKKTILIGLAPGTITLHGVDGAETELGPNELHRIAGAVFDLAKTVGLDLP
jgi:hypothetical protein